MSGRLARIGGASTAALVALLLVGCGPESGWEDEENFDTEEWGAGPVHPNGTPETSIKNVELAGIPKSRICSGPDPVDPSHCTLSSAWATWRSSPYAADRAQLIDSLVRCALPGGYRVDIPGWESAFGVWGWVPGFKTNALNIVHQEKLTGCALALINANHSHVNIAIVAPHDLAPPSTSMPYMEAVFYGNLFQPGPARIACGGIRSPGVGWVPGRLDRLCGNPDNPCYIDAVGTCNGPYVPGASGYCADYAGTPMWQGTGATKHCAAARDDGQRLWEYPSTVYLFAEPFAWPGPISRCGDSNAGTCAAQQQ